MCPIYHYPRSTLSKPNSEFLNMLHTLNNTKYKSYYNLQFPSKNVSVFRVRNEKLHTYLLHGAESFLRS